ncbi:MAG: hypothetical protein Q8P73_00170 [bacterium]|nr:hypothetical protein [bacterium]
MKIRWNDFPHVYEMQQFSAEDMEAIIGHTLAMEDAMAALKPLPRLSQPHPWNVRLLFYEPSTRTEMTFIDAALALGCNFHAVKDPKTFSSAIKGESSFAAVAAYGCTGGMGYLRQSDMLIIRHNEDNATRRAAEIINAALDDKEPRLSLAAINAGDSKNQHPTQALVDLATIFKERQNGSHPLDDLTVLFPGDLQRSRVINSLLYSFGKFGHDHHISVIFCCPKGFGPKVEILEYLARHHVAFEFRFKKNDFVGSLPEADVVYMNRLQRERVKIGEKKIRRKRRRAYVFWADYLRYLKDGAFVMHPLPINEDPADPPPEIDPKLMPLAHTNDLRCAWFRQSHRGKPMRTALLDIIFAAMDEEMTAIKAI